LPQSMQNARKIRTVSGSMKNALPSKITPFTESEESEVIVSLLREIDANFGVRSGAPVFNRSCATDGTGNSRTAKFAIFGGSHASRVAKHIADLGGSIENCARGGWVLSKDTAAELCNKIRDTNLGEGGEDVVILDPLSNSAFFGTGEDAVPVAAKKDGAGKYHLEGDIMVATPAMARSKLKLLSNLLPSDKNIHYIVVAPTPRYFSDPCCGQAEHCTNFSERGFMKEILGGIEAIEEVLKNFVREEGLNATVLNPAKILGIEDTVSDPTTAADQWQPGDPVHLRAENYRRMAEAVVEAVMTPDDTSEAGSLAKRARLECTVVKAGGESNRPVSFITPGWSSGQLPVKPPLHSVRGRGGGGGWRGRFWRPPKAFRGRGGR